MNLQVRGILITGASPGLGKAIAESCVSAGADVYICARGSEELQQTCRELQARTAPGQQIRSRTTDVSDPKAVAELIEDACRSLPRFTGLVNNAGVYGPK